MKSYILALIVLIGTCVLNAQVSKTDLNGKIGISLYGGVNIPAKGDISTSIKSTDLLNSGPNFGFGVSYFFTKTIGVEAVAGYHVNLYSDKYKLNGKQPAVSVTSFSLNGIYNFGHLIKNNRFSPYVRAGIEL
jgi:outer membrane protein W